MQKLNKNLLLSILITFLFIGCSSKPKPVYSYQPPLVPIKYIKYDNGDYEFKFVPAIRTFFGTWELEES